MKKRESIIHTTDGIFKLAKKLSWKNVFIPKNLRNKISITFDKENIVISKIK